MGQGRAESGERQGGGENRKQKPAVGLGILRSATTEILAWNGERTNWGRGIHYVTSICATFAAGRSTPVKSPFTQNVQTLFFHFECFRFGLESLPPPPPPRTTASNTMTTTSTSTNHLPPALVKQVETVQTRAAKKSARMLKHDEQYTLLRAELGMYPLETNRDTRKLKRQYKARNMPTKRFQAIANRAVWQKMTQGQAETRLNNIVEKVWKDMESKKR